MILFWIGNVPFHCFRRFFYRLAGMKIGRGSTIHMWARFYQPDNIVIGEDTIIGDHCFLDGRQKLTIGNHVAMASEVSIYNSEHDIQSEDFRPASAWWFLAAARLPRSAIWSAGQTAPCTGPNTWDATASKSSRCSKSDTPRRSAPVFRSRCPQNWLPYPGLRCPHRPSNILRAAFCGCAKIFHWTTVPLGADL